MAVSQYSLCLQIDKTVFDILYREKIKKDRENLAKFLQDYFPGMSKNYTLHRIVSSVDYIFIQKTICKGEYIIQEGFDSNRLFIIREGTC